MKNVIAILCVLSISSTVFASTRGDLNAAFSFLYEKSVRSSMQAEQMSKIYISILNSENSCIKKTSQFCEDSSVSPQIEKMITLRTEAYFLMGKPRTEKTIEKVKSLEAERDALGQELVDQVVKGL